MFETIMSYIFSQYAAAVIGAIGVFILGYMGVKWKKSKEQIVYEDTKLSQTAIKNQRLVRRNGKLVAQLLAHSGREMAHKAQYEHVLTLVEDNYPASAKKRLLVYIGKAEEDFKDVMTSLDEISDISEVIYDDEINEVMSEVGE